VLSLPEAAPVSIEMRVHQTFEAHRDSPTNAMIQQRRFEGELERESEPVFVGMRAKQKLLAWRAAKRQRHRERCGEIQEPNDFTYLGLCAYMVQSRLSPLVLVQRSFGTPPQT
jgi:hypothetical protein